MRAFLVVVEDVVCFKNIQHRPRQMSEGAQRHLPANQVAIRDRQTFELRMNRLAAADGRQLLFYCAFGERSAMAVQAAQDARLASARHVQGGIDAWKKAAGPLERPGTS